MQKDIAIGCIVGFSLFLLSLESKGMGNIIIRNGQFTPSNILHFMKSPLHQYYLWMPQLWSSNWIMMTTLGGIAGYYAKYLIK